MHWIECEGKMVKSFLHLEDNYSGISLNEVWTGTKYVSTSDEILPILHDFYSHLYENVETKTDTEINDFLASLPLPKIRDSTTLLGDITSKEVELAIKKLHPGKAPGLDGLTADLYTHFSDQLCNILAGVYNEIFKNNSLSFLQRLAIIILLYKKGDNWLVENYLPISLTNTDYKILAYILTMCLDSLLVDVIHINQTAYMSQHFIGINI